MKKRSRANVIVAMFLGILLCLIAYITYQRSLNERLRVAVREHREEEAITLLQRGADPNIFRTGRGNSRRRDYVFIATILPGTGLRLIQAFLDHGINLNSQGVGERALQQALSSNRADILRLLLEKGASIPEKDRTSFVRSCATQECYLVLQQYHYPTTFGMAISFGDTAAVQGFLDRGADLNQSYEAGATQLSATPLTIALNSGEDGILKLLLAHGADVNKTSYGISPLYLALHSSKKKPKIVALLQANGAHLTLQEQILTGNAQGVRDLIRAGANVNQLSFGTMLGQSLSTGHPPLFDAIRTGNVEIVRLLLNSGADINFKTLQGQTPLMQAAEGGNLEILRALIAKGANLRATDIRSLTAVKSALHSHRMDAYRLLKAQGATVDLFDAAFAGDVEVIHALARQGTDVNKRDWESNTPLMIAAIHGQVPAVYALLDEGANIEAKSYSGETALLKVAWSNHTDSLRALLDRGANLNVVLPDGKTALIRATQAGRLNNLRLLLTKGADNHIHTKKGDTALSIAAKYGHTDAVAMLRQAGALE